MIPLSFYRLRISRKSVAHNGRTDGLTDGWAATFNAPQGKAALQS